MNDRIWEAVAVATETLDRLRREVARCAVASPYRLEPANQVAELAAQREYLLSGLCKAVSGELPTSDDASR